MSENQKEITIDDLIDATHDGIDQGYVYGFMSAILGTDWPKMYEQTETEKLMVKSAWLLAHEKQKEFEKNKLMASGVLLKIAYENYKAVENKS